MSLKRNIKGNEWAEALKAVLQCKEENIPAGWLSSAEVGKKFGLSQCQTQKNLAIMIKEGLVEVKKFKASSRHGTGIIRATPYYRLLKSFPASKK